MRHGHGQGNAHCGVEMKKVFRRPYAYWVVGIFFLYMATNVLISQFYVTVQYIPYYLDTIKWEELLLGALLSISIGSLVAINSVHAYLLHQEHRKMAKESAMTCAATVGGLATGICSACVAGLVPLIFSVFGISFSWAALPFKGLEVQAAILALLVFTMVLLNKKAKVNSHETA